MVGVRRYRMINGTFDTRSHLIVDEISANWEPNIRAQHWSNRLRALEWLKYEFGEDGLGEKVAEFGALGSEPFSVLAYHNVFFRQVRRAERPLARHQYGRHGQEPAAVDHRPG